VWTSDRPCTQGNRRLSLGLNAFESAASKSASAGAAAAGAAAGAGADDDMFLGDMDESFTFAAGPAHSFPFAGFQGTSNS